MAVLDGYRILQKLAAGNDIAPGVVQQDLPGKMNSKARLKIVPGVAGIVIAERCRIRIVATIFRHHIHRGKADVIDVEAGIGLQGQIFQRVNPCFQPQVGKVTGFDSGCQEVLSGLPEIISLAEPQIKEFTVLGRAIGGPEPAGQIIGQRPGQHVLIGQFVAVIEK